MKVGDRVRTNEVWKQQVLASEGEYKYPGPEDFGTVTQIEDGKPWPVNVHWDFMESALGVHYYNPDELDVIE